MRPGLPPVDPDDLFACARGLCAARSSDTDGHGHDRLLRHDRCASARIEKELCADLFKAERALGNLYDRYHRNDMYEEACRLHIVKDLAPDLLAQTAIGLNREAQLLLTAGDNPERPRSGASFAALCSVCPAPASPGKTVRHRLNRRVTAQPTVPPTSSPSGTWICRGLVPHCGHRQERVPSIATAAATTVHTIIRRFCVSTV